VARGRRVLKKIRGYAELQDVFRERLAAFSTDMEAVDELAGWATGYCSKLLSPSAMRCFGPMSLDVMLAALGVTLIAVEDPKSTDRARQRLRRRSFAPYEPPPVVLRFSRAHYRRMARARMQKVSPERRSEIARIASLKRWRKPRIEEVPVPASGEPPAE
jgi:predicted transcriptional regulator